MTTGNATTAGGGGLSGIYPYPVSPLDGRGRVDERALRRLVGHLLDEGVHGLSPSDSTGEVTHLTPAQREAVCGSPSTRPPAGCRSSRGWRPSPAPMPRPRRRPWPRGGSTASSASSWSTASRPPTRSSTTSTRSPRPRTCRSSSARIRVSDLPLSALERIVADETVQYLEDASGVTGRLLTIRPALGGRLRFFAASAHLPAAALDLGGVGRMAGPACVAAGVLGQQVPQGRGVQQRHVPAGHHDRPGEVRRQRRQAAGDGASRARDLVLVGGHGVRGHLGQVGDDGVALVAHDDHEVVGVQAAGRGDGVRKEAASADGVQHLGRGRAHAGAFACGHDDDGGGCGCGGSHRSSSRW